MLPVEEAALNCPHLHCLYMIICHSQCKASAHCDTADVLKLAAKQTVVSLVFCQHFI